MRIHARKPRISVFSTFLGNSFLIFLRIVVAGQGIFVGKSMKKAAPLAGLIWVAARCIGFLPWKKQTRKGALQLQLGTNTTRREPGMETILSFFGVTRQVFWNRPSEISDSSGRVLEFFRPGFGILPLEILSDLENPFCMFFQ